MNFETIREVESQEMIALAPPATPCHPENCTFWIVSKFAGRICDDDRLNTPKQRPSHSDKRVGSYAAVLD